VLLDVPEDRVDRQGEVLHEPAHGGIVPVTRLTLHRWRNGRARNRAPTLLGVTTSLPPGEPAAGPWRTAPLSELVELVLGPGGAPQGRPRVVAVDGRGAGGKTTLARRLAGAVPPAAVVHTDDVAWHHSFFDWADLLADGILAPARRGEAVHYRPPGWEARGRPGAIELPAGLDLLVVEGVGAGRRELASVVDAVVWVQSDPDEAKRRGIVRDVAEGHKEDEATATAFWDEWMAEELPFLADQRPWERACVVVAGTPPVPLGPDEVLLAPPPPRSA
jgi:hypothetical protein